MKLYSFFKSAAILLALSCATKGPANKNDNFTSVKTLLSPNKFECCQPDSNLFLYHNLSKTIDCDDLSSIEKMHNLDSNQINAWIKPILKDIQFPLDFEKSGHSFKMASFQKKTNEYTSIILILAFNEFQQLFLTISPEGKAIDYLKVSYVKNLSNWNVEYDNNRALFKFSTKIISCFEIDTISVYSIEDVSKIEEPHLSKDFWQELFVTKYIIKKNGKLEMFDQRRQIDSSNISKIINVTI